MPLPKKVEVGARTYTVTASRTEVNTEALVMKAQEGLYGVTDHDALTIVLNPDIGDGRRKDTLVHEILHTITNFAGLDKDLTREQEEKVANRMAPVLLNVLRSNPRLVEYLLS